MQELTAHPAADIFPMMDGQHFADLVADIQANGVRLPIVLCDGMILDGRNRYKACAQLGIAPPLETYDGDPFAYVWSLNGARRDLVKEQRYLIWRECEGQSEAWQAEQRRWRDSVHRTRKQAADARPRNDDGTWVASPATECGATGQRDFAREAEAKSSTAKAAASQTNRGAVERGDKLATARPDLAEKVRLGEMRPAEAHRQMKRDAVAEKVEALPDDVYTVIYADPPWKYNDAQAVKGEYGTGTGAATAHYPSMTLAELRALDVPSLAAADCVLFLWATSPLLPDALELAKAWGFTYKAAFVWDKIKHNMGHYNSVRHEFLLICTRGSCTPHNVKLFDSVQSIERTEHSAKPERFREIIETLYPHGNKIELFRRGNAPNGWAIWGNEAHGQ